MKLFACAFRWQIEDDDWRSVEAYDEEHAASKFAEEAQHKHMWEHEEDDWTGEYAVAVQAPLSEKMQFFNIARTVRPVFVASPERT